MFIFAQIMQLYFSWFLTEIIVPDCKLIIFFHFKDPTRFIIKRIAALEGDIVHNSKSRFSGVIPKGHCWVEGDNPQVSVDSLKYGAIPTGLIHGKVKEKKWLLNEIRILTI